MKNIRQGELLLIPVKENLTGGKIEKDYVVSHSETGHHHMLMGMVQVFNNQIIKLDQDTQLEHKKSFDRHETITVPSGYYRVVKKTEYDPFLKVIREVHD